MVEYLKQLKNNIELVKAQIQSEENECKKIELQIQLNNLEDKATNFFKVVFSGFSEQQLKAFANESVDQQAIAKAEQETAKFNSAILNGLIRQAYDPMESAEKEIRDILLKNPDADNEQNKETADYKIIQARKKDIQRIQNFIETQKRKIESFYSKLSNEDKEKMFDKAMENLDKGNLDLQEAKKKVEEHLPVFDFHRKEKFLLENRIDEIVEKNQDKALADYLLQNKEDIKRLTIRTDPDVTERYFSALVKSVDVVLNATHHEQFSAFAKEKGIADITTEKASFKSDKINFIKEDHQRFLSCKKEIKTTEQTKANFKLLLKEMDSLNIIDNQSFVGESRDKEYGFTKFIKLKHALADELNAENVSKERVEKALKDLKEEEQKIFKMYDLIQKTLGDDYFTMPQNVDSYRNVEVPAEFKQNLAVQSKFNSLYIMLSFIKEKGLTIDEFVDNPVACTDRCFQENFDKRNVDKVLKGKTKSEALLYFATRKIDTSLEDPFKYARSYEMIVTSEQDPELRKDNLLSFVAISSMVGNLNRAASIRNDYLIGNYKETLQNIFLVKENADGEIPYMKCFVSSASYQDDMVTGFVDEKPTAVEQIQKHDNIEKAFYDSIEILKNYTLAENEDNKEKRRITSSNLLSTVQEFAVKILYTIDFDKTNAQGEKVFSENFFNDVCNVITDYKQIAILNDFDYQIEDREVSNMIRTLNNKENLLKETQKQLNESQIKYEEDFIREFEKLNKDIDELDKKAEKIAKKLQKGESNKEIDDISIEQIKKFNDIRKLQNARIDQLRSDLEKGKVSQYYFDKRTEQISLLQNVKELPAMFLHEEKSYKNFKAYLKEQRKLSNKRIASTRLAEMQREYNRIVEESKEEKRLFIINKTLEKKGLSANKAVNVKKAQKIEIQDQTKEMQEIQNERFNQESLIERESIVVDLPQSQMQPEKVQPVNENNKKIQKVEQKG